MIGFSHVILHVGLCNAIARAKPQTDVAMRVRLSFHVGPPQIDQVLHFQRGDGQEATVEFDVARGTYRVQLDAPKFNCAATDFLTFLSDRNRVVAIPLSDGPAPPVQPMVLLDGEAPMSFQYVRPTFVMFDGSLACDQAVGNPLPTKILVEHDRDSYYVQLHFDPSLIAQDPVMALRLRTPTGLYHYIRVKIGSLLQWGGWPSNIQFNVTEDELDSLATEKTEVLLCPKLWRSSVSGEAMPKQPPQQQTPQHAPPAQAPAQPTAAPPPPASQASPQQEPQQQTSPPPPAASPSP